MSIQITSRRSVSVVREERVGSRTEGQRRNGGDGLGTDFIEPSQYGEDFGLYVD